MNIALDLEGPCANAHRATVDRDDDIEWNWFDGWKTMDDDQYKKYIHVSQNLWHNHHEEVPLAEEGVALYVDMLCQENTVEMLTARCEVDEQIQDWLALHEIGVDGFTSTREPKHIYCEPEYDGYDQYRSIDCGPYDAIIDDNPTLDGKVDLLFLYDRPWNQDVDADGVNTIRVESLADVVDMVRGGVMVHRGNDEN